MSIKELERDLPPTVDGIEVSFNHIDLLVKGAGDSRYQQFVSSAGTVLV
jgi:hypothetical protein